MVISTKLGEVDWGWSLGDIRGSYGTGLWKDIRKDWSTFSQNVVFSLGDGRRLNFMEGLLVLRASLMHYFPLSF